MKRLKPIRFSIRSLLLLAALIAIYLGWRLRNPESEVVAAINDAGGRVVLGCNIDSIFEGSERSFSPIAVATNSKPVPPITFSELVFGDRSDRRVQVVELPIEKITPELSDKLETLRDMQFLIVKLPENPSIHDLDVRQPRQPAAIDIPDGKFKHRLAELQAIFGNLLRCY